MKKLGISVTAIALFAFMSCKNEKKQMDENQTTTEEIGVGGEVQNGVKTLNVMLESKSGSTAVGEAVFSEENGKVRLEAKIMGLKPGTHAIHLHEKADCSAADGASAGGHWNPTFEEHGKWSDPEGFHRGDIGNFEVNSEGMGKISMETDLWCIGCADEKKNIVGKAIIIHEGVDDFVTQPTGDAGGRLSCGGIIQ